MGNLEIYMSINEGSNIRQQRQYRQTDDWSSSRRLTGLTINNNGNVTFVYCLQLHMHVILSFCLFSTIVTPTEERFSSYTRRQMVPARLLSSYARVLMQRHLFPEEVEIPHEVAIPRHERFSSSSECPMEFFILIFLHESDGEVTSFTPSVEGFPYLLHTREGYFKNFFPQ